MPDRILLIDDDPGISSALTTRLSVCGYSVHAASDGRSGLVAAHEFSPDAIVLDIRLPDLDGFEVCRRLKASSATAEIPVVFLSANIAEGARHSALEAGGDAFLSKPYESKDLIQAVRSVCNKTIQES